MTDVGDSIVFDDRRWTFANQKVVDNFDYHIENSVPLYHQGHDLICKLSDFFVSQGSLCYDLGCATARLTAKLATRHRNLDVIVKGVDVEPSMIAQAETNCRQLETVELLTADINDIEFQSCDLIVSYYTLQFVPLAERQELLTKIYRTLRRGGALILFEKILAHDAYMQDIANLIVNEHKLDNGYQPAEIVAKATSLKGVLRAVTDQQNQQMLKQAGFEQVAPLMRYLSFTGYLASKTSIYSN